MLSINLVSPEIHAHMTNHITICSQTPLSTSPSSGKDNNDIIKPMLSVLSSEKNHEMPNK